MGWFIFTIVIALILFVISKRGPVKEPKSNSNIREVEYNLKDYPNEYNFSVAGVHLERYSYPLFNICKVLNLVDLVPEPTNTYGSDAIKVQVSGWHIGYVPSVETSELHEIIKKEHIAYIESLNIIGYITVAVKIRYKD